ncbi:MAG: class I SAM-dependent methyltransferase [Bacteroidia bacterium]|nr:class I SAM-dependent methyltransferase [Bacteroidia bacterium]
MIGQFLFRLSNNILLNNLAIALGFDHFLTSRLGLYARCKPDASLSPQEMAGFSTRKEVQEAIDKTHHDLSETVKQYLEKGDAILDIGCGAGAYLKEFEKDYTLCGIDVNTEMTAAASRNIPSARIVHANFLDYDFETKFKLIYSISVLEFIPPSRLRAFFRKIHLLLEEDGIVFLHYPHALRFIDTLFPDLYYIEYSPRRVENALKNNFKIIRHQHGYDGRKIDLYDPKPYEPGIRTFKNGYLLVAMRKGKANL